MLKKNTRKEIKQLEMKQNAPTLKYIEFNEEIKEKIG